jgi:hypothetical protein
MMSFPLLDEDPERAQMFPVQNGGFQRDYVSVCLKVMHEHPYLPDDMP